MAQKQERTKKPRNQRKSFTPAKIYPIVNGVKILKQSIKMTVADIEKNSNPKNMAYYNEPGEQYIFTKNEMEEEAWDLFHTLSIKPVHLLKAAIAKDGSKLFGLNPYDGNFVCKFKGFLVKGNRDEGAQPEPKFHVAAPNQWGNMNDAYKSFTAFFEVESINNKDILKLLKRDHPPTPRLRRTN